MANIPSVDALKAVHAFPGPYTMKVVGHARDAFIGRLIIAVREEMGLDKDPDYTIRQSEGGRHVAITINLFAQSAEQVIAVYKVILTIEGLVLLL